MEARLLAKIRPAVRALFRWPRPPARTWSRLRELPHRLRGQRRRRPAWPRANRASRSPPRSSGTRLTYTVEAAVGGKLGQIGGRLVNASARKMADELLSRAQRAARAQARGAGARSRRRTGPRHGAETSPHVGGTRARRHRIGRLRPWSGELQRLLAARDRQRHRLAREPRFSEPRKARDESPRLPPTCARSSLAQTSALLRERGDAAACWPAARPCWPRSTCGCRSRNC